MARAQPRRGREQPYPGRGRSIEVVMVTIAHQARTPCRHPGTETTCRCTRPEVPVSQPPLATDPLFSTATATSWANRGMSRSSDRRWARGPWGLGQTRGTECPPLLPALCGARQRSVSAS